MPEREPGRLGRWVSNVATSAPFVWIPQFRRAYNEDFIKLQKIQLLLSFLEAHQNAQHEVPKYFATEASAEMREVESKVRKESIAQCQSAKEMLREHSQELQDLAKSEMLARKVLHIQAKEIAEMQEKGVITASEANDFKHQIYDAASDIRNKPSSTWLDERFGGAEHHSQDHFGMAGGTRYT